jgi:CDP-diacylglycerol--glycerol-3-phosphate 3-phosphatidyltransferase
MSAIDSEFMHPLNRLRLQWAVFTVAAIGAVWIFFAALQAAWSPGYAWQWIFQAALLSVFPLAVLWRGLPLNRRPGEDRLLPTLGAGNLLSTTRGILIAGLGGFLFLPRPGSWVGWIPACLYTVAALADLFDGYLARRFKQETWLGETLDMSFDGLGVFVGSLLIVQYGQAPWFYLLVGLARYLFLIGIWIRRRLGKPVYELAERPARRPLAGAQMGFIAAALSPVFSPPGIALAATLFALPFLVSFLRDWLTVSGAFIPASHRGRSGRLVERKSPLAELFRWSPLILRIFAAGLLAAWMSGPGDVSPGLMTLAVLGGFMLAAGAAGRLAALIVLFVIGINLGPVAPGILDILLIAVTIILFHAGSGPWSLWVPERRLLDRRLGDGRG